MSADVYLLCLVFYGVAALASNGTGVGSGTVFSIIYGRCQGLAGRYVRAGSGLA
jgi:hypothetical protein